MVGVWLVMDGVRVVAVVVVGDSDGHGHRHRSPSWSGTVDRVVVGDRVGPVVGRRRGQQWPLLVVVKDGSHRRRSSGKGLVVLGR